MPRWPTSAGLSSWSATLLARHGTDAQQERYLRPLLRGERRCAYAITEAEAGSDVAGIRTTAVRAGAGWRLDGGKLWIHNAPVCDFAVVLARTDKEAGRRGMSIFLVDRDRPGFSVGQREHKMGQRASPVGALHFDGVELPAEALLGEEGRGFHMMMSVLDKGRVGIAALAVGIAQAGLEAAVGYARQRRQFGQAVAEFQGLQWLLADMAKDIQAARLLTLGRGRSSWTAASPRPWPARWPSAWPRDVAVARRLPMRCRSSAAAATSRASRSSGSTATPRSARSTRARNQIQRTIIARELLRRTMA